MSMTNKILRITRKQYREFAEIAKKKGCALNLSVPTRIGRDWWTSKNYRAWGSVSRWALSVCTDATDPNTTWSERGLVTLSSSIDTIRWRNAKRPELDWSQLEDEEIYPFILWHEIGHLTDNFDIFELIILKDPDIRDQCHKYTWLTNEVLADRFAWNKIRPGEPIPICESGQANQEVINTRLDYMNKHCPKIKEHKVDRSLRAGQYHDVPEYMLMSPARAAFIGPKVSQQLIFDSCQRHRLYAQKGREPLF